MALCIQCDLEFPTIKELGDHVKSGHKTKPSDWKPKIKRITLDQADKLKEPIKQTVAEKKPEKPQPIKLVYKYEGHCPECGNEVETIMLEMGKGLKAVAYCLHCKKKLQEQTVKKL